MVNTAAVCFVRYFTMQTSTINGVTERFLCEVGNRVNKNYDNFMVCLIMEDKQVTFSR